MFIFLLVYFLNLLMNVCSNWTNDMDFEAKPKLLVPFEHTFLSNLLITPRVTVERVTQNLRKN
jgi:hypothetical protein